MSVEATASPTDEVSGPGTFTFSRDFPISTSFPEPALVVKFEFVGTATYGANADYVSSPAATGNPPSGAVTFQPGSTTATVTIDPNFDLDPDTLGDAVTLRIVEDPAYNIDEEDGEATINIPNYAANTVSAAVLDEPFTEAGSPAAIRLARTGNLASPLTVKVRMGGTAIQGSSGDYTAAPSLGTAADTEVQIPANQASIDIALTPVQDAISEELETVELTILPGPSTTPSQPSTHYLLGTPASVSTSLQDDERPSITLAASDATATEASETSGTFTLTRVGAKANPLSVTAVLSGSAFLTEYEVTGLSSSQVTFAPNAETAVVTVRAKQDATPEGTESVILTIGASSTAYNIVGPASATILIEDDDAPLVTLTSIDYNATEANLGTATLTVTRSSIGLANPLQVLYTLGGTANATNPQRDYAVTPAGGKINFTANTATMTVTVTPIQDTRGEPAETVVFTLAANGTAYGLANPNAITVNLADDDVSTVDTDADGVPDATDNCVSTPNGQSQTGLDARQNNTDADAFGDACDPDDDNDGLSDSAEATVTKTKPKVRDTDGDARGDGDEVTAGTKPLDRFSPEYRASSVTTRSTGKGIEVNWTAPAGSLATRYLVFRASTPTYLGQVPAASPKSFLDEKFPGTNASHASHVYYVQAMLPDDLGTAFNGTVAGPGSAPLSMALCDAFPADADGDGLCDRGEAASGTDPNDADSDGDGASDLAETQADTDPLDPKSGGTTQAVDLTREAPFWVGVAIAAAALATLGIAIGKSRRGRGDGPLH